MDPEASKQDGGIGDMPLYLDIRRITNELAALGLGPDDDLSPEQIYDFDQLHYHGIDAVRAAAGLIGLGRDSKVLEIGSGLGGPARYLAHTVGCAVTALELQPEMHDLALSLTRRCGLQRRVTHVRGDALTYPLEVGGVDAVVSWMAFHHIADRPALLAHLHHAIRPGGHIYVEDLVLQEISSREDYMKMRQVLFAQTLTDAEDFAQELEDAGFDQIDMTDMTASWSTFVAARSRAFHDRRERHDRVLGEPVAARLDAFYSTVAGLFFRGGLGGVRLAARRP